MVNHYQIPPFGRICLEHFPSIEHANPRLTVLEYIPVYMNIDVRLDRLKMLSPVFLGGVVVDLYLYIF